MGFEKKTVQRKDFSAYGNFSGSKAIQKKSAVGVIQKVEPLEDPTQKKSDGTVQREEAPALEEEGPRGVTNSITSQKNPATNDVPLQRKENKTGMPDHLKSGIENLSGMSMDHVKVHYNSSQPAQLNALAYAQGSDIHVGPGQEKHLPHEAWHVVQQAQGRVQPTTQMKAGVAVNDDPGLEHEADVMGEKAMSVGMGGSIIQSFACGKLNSSSTVQMGRGHGRFKAVASAGGGNSITNMFVTSHLGNEATARQIAMNRGLPVSHTIDIGELGSITSEMSNRIANGYYTPANQVNNPNGNPNQYLTANSYNIWETKSTNKGKLKKTKLIKTQFYYDAPAAHGHACHHFDGVF